jgi:hypothetical protein
MSPNQLLGELFWNPAAVSSLPTFIASLAMAAALGALLGQAYVRFGRSLSNRRSFARNFLLVTVTTTLIISIIKSSLALSLGLVGALSIVRFRAAIKEPEELAYLFLAISVGLGLGAGQALLTIVAFVLIVGLMAIASLTRPAPDQPSLYLTISAPPSDSMDAARVRGLLTEAGVPTVLKRLDSSPDGFEASFSASVPDVSVLAQAERRLRDAIPAVRVTCLDDRGLSQ